MILQGYFAAQEPTALTAATTAESPASPAEKQLAALYSFKESAWNEL